MSRVERPEHYQDEDGKDLFDEWYERYSLKTFTIVMECVAERYLYRAGKKDDEMEDLKKAQYIYRRLVEYLHPE